MPSPASASRNVLQTRSTSTHVRGFLLFLASERGLADNSIHAYRRDLEDMDDFFKTQGKDLALGEPDDYRAYLRNLTRQGKSTQTVTRRLACIRVFMKFLAENEVDAPGRNRVLQQLERPKPEQPLPMVLTRDQVNRLINAPDPASRLFDRDVAILELLYASGVRASELCGLRLSDLNLTGRCVRVLGKGSKERIVPLGRAAAEAIGRYLEHRQGEDQPVREELFLSRTGRPLERVALWMLVEKQARRAGLLKEVSPHVLRHCFATHLISGGADLRVVQELLGHADIQTTQVYTHVDQDRLKSVHRRFHPRG
jgi:integrase/recombinase XerD